MRRWVSIRTIPLTALLPKSIAPCSRIPKALLLGVVFLLAATVSGITAPLRHKPTGKRAQTHQVRVIRIDESHHEAVRHVIRPRVIHPRVIHPRIIHPVHHIFHPVHHVVTRVTHLVRREHPPIRRELHRVVERRPVHYVHHPVHGRIIHVRQTWHRRPAYWDGLQCVTYARTTTGIELTGNAVSWWWHAAGRYARGQTPERGAVLNFRANTRMRLGHVAVVARVLNSREIEVDQANWPAPGENRDGITHDIRVVDVSPHNNWTAVRVAIGHTDRFGSVYPTYGFIYDRSPGAPDPHPQILAQAVLPPLGPAPSDLRPLGARGPLATVSDSYAEVAELPTSTRPIILTLPAITPRLTGAPDRALR